MQTKIKLIAVLGILTFFMSCSDDETANMVSNETPFQELYDQGIDRYLGVFTPSRSEGQGNGLTLHTFQGLEGPICFTGNEFTMSTRDGSGDELMIFLQAGGACGPTTCDAVDSTTTIPPFGILSPSGGNPTASYDVGYIPYCDGTLFTGDVDVDSDGDGNADRFFRGVQNLSAALDVIARSYPNPRMILLTGNSAGGAGVHYALPLVRKLYPEVRIELINDSGLGILQPGSQEGLNAYWNSEAFFPESCATCIGEDGHLTDYHKYQLAEDDNLRMGFISFKQDQVVADERLMIGGPAFEAELLPAMGELREAYPDRFRSMIANGNEHTFIIRRFDYTVGGITVQEWVTNMLNGSEDWVSVTE